MVTAGHQKPSATAVITLKDFSVKMKSMLQHVMLCIKEKIRNHELWSYQELWNLLVYIIGTAYRSCIHDCTRQTSTELLQVFSCRLRRYNLTARLHRFDFVLLKLDCLPRGHERHEREVIIILKDFVRIFPENIKTCAQMHSRVAWVAIYSKSSKMLPDM